MVLLTNIDNGPSIASNSFSNSLNEYFSLNIFLYYISLIFRKIKCEQMYRNLLKERQ